MPNHLAERHRYHIISFGTAGDMHPFLSVAKALQARGHDVTFIGFQAHAAMVQPLGISYVSIGEEADYERAMNAPDLWHPRKGLAVIFKHQFKERIQNDIAAYFEALPNDQHHIALAHPLAVPSVAVFRSRLPLLRLVGVYLAPSNFKTVHAPLTLGELQMPRWMPKRVIEWLWSWVYRFYIDPAAIPPLNAWRARYGLAPVAHYMDHVYSAPDASVALFPAWFGKPQPDWPSPMLMGTFPLFEPAINATLPTELAQFLAAGDAPVVFAPGSGQIQAGAYFAKALKVVARLQVRAIFLTPFPEQLPRTLPTTVLWQAYVPFNALLPKVAALVHHGGIGTTAQALRAGVPQLVVPFAFDQFDNAVRVEMLGCGFASLAAPRAPVWYLSWKLRRLLNSAPIKQSCQAIAKRFASESTMDEVCAKILAMDASIPPIS